MLLSWLSLFAFAAPVPVCDTAQGQGLVPSRDGHLFARWELAPQWELDPVALEGIAGTVQRLDQQGVAVVVLLTPTRPMAVDVLAKPMYARKRAVESYQQARDSLRGAGVQVVDVLDVALAHEGSDFFWKLDHHWTPEGAKATAGVVAEHIRGRDLREPLVSGTFETTAVDAFTREGNMSARVHKACPGIQHEPMLWPKYQTVRKGVGLLDEVPAAQVVVVGTSQMSEEWNFPGFLAQELQSDVLDASVGGGHAMGGLLNWLRSAERAAHLPSIVVWEIDAGDFVTSNKPHFPELSDPVAWRRIHGALAGCGTSVAKGPAPLTLAEPSAEGWTLVVHTQKKVPASVTLRLGRAGKTEVVELLGWRKVPDDGRRFWLLDEGVTSVAVVAPAKLGAVEVELCRP